MQDRAEAVDVRALRDPPIRVQLFGGHEAGGAAGRAGRALHLGGDGVDVVPLQAHLDGAALGRPERRQHAAQLVGQARRHPIITEKKER